MDNGLEKWEYHHSRSVQKGVNYVPKEWKRRRKRR
jgi:hypothetical protein